MLTINGFIKRLRKGCSPREEQMLDRVVSSHRRFNSADQWFAAVSSHFVGANSSPRAMDFSLTAHLNTVAGFPLFDINVHQSGYARGVPGFSCEGALRHRYFALWQAKGVSVARQAGKIFTLRPGQWVVFQTGLPCSFNVRDGARVLGVMLPEGRDTRADWAELIGSGGCLLPPSEDGDMAATLFFEALGRSMPLEGRVQKSLEGLVVNLLDSALQQSAVSRPLADGCRGVSVKLQQAKALIAEQLENPELSPELIGKAIGVSRRGLYLMFSDVGETPMGCIRTLRLDAAAKRLRSSSSEIDTISKVALDLGFSDPSHFSRLFRMRFGLTPRCWMLRNIS